MGTTLKLPQKRGITATSFRKPKLRHGYSTLHYGESLNSDGRGQFVKLISWFR